MTGRSGTPGCRPRTTGASELPGHLGKKIVQVHLEMSICGVYRGGLRKNNEWDRAAGAFAAKRPQPSFETIANYGCPKRLTNYKNDWCLPPVTHPQIPPFNPTHGATRRIDCPPGVGVWGKSDGQFLSTFATPPVDDRTTTGSAHAFAKAVLVSSLAVTRLKCALHGGKPESNWPGTGFGFGGLVLQILRPFRRRSIKKNRDDSTICQMKTRPTEPRE